MIRTLACALLAVAPQAAPPDGQAATPPPMSAVFEFVQPANPFTIHNVYDEAAAVREGAKIGGRAWDSWSLGPQPRDLGLAKLDAATRAQLKVPEGRGLVAAGLGDASPAWQAGLRNDDILLSLDDEPLAEPGDLERLLKKAGEKPATLALIRKAKPTTIQVQARIRAELGPVPSQPPEFWIGASVAAVAPALRAQLDIPADRGLAVTELADGSPAAAAGLQAGDVILTVDGAPIADPAALRDRVAQSEGKPLTLEFLGSGEKKSLKVTPTKRSGHATEVSTTEFRINFIDVARPGVVFQGDGQGLTFGQNNTAGSQTAPPAADASKFDALSTEVKALREAVESLRKTLDEKK